MHALWMLAVGGCSSHAVENCDFYPETDCCVVSRDCFDFYGADLPYCSLPVEATDPSFRGGVCSECLRDEHCPDGSWCFVDDAGFGACRDESKCYPGTPHPDGC